MAELNTRGRPRKDEDDLVRPRPTRKPSPINRWLRDLRLESGYKTKAIASWLCANEYQITQSMVIKLEGISEVKPKVQRLLARMYKKTYTSMMQVAGILEQDEVIVKREDVKVKRLRDGAEL